MTPPTVQFIPASGPTLEYQGPDDGAAFGNGCEFLFADCTFTIGSAPSGFTSTVARRDHINAFFWIVPAGQGSSAWSTFVATYPETGTWKFWYDLNNAAGKYKECTTNPGWSYVLGIGGNSQRPGISFSDFDRYPGTSNTDYLQDVILKARYTP